MKERARIREEVVGFKQRSFQNHKDSNPPTEIYLKRSDVLAALNPK